MTISEVPDAELLTQSKKARHVVKARLIAHDHFTLFMRVTIYSYVLLVEVKQLISCAPRALFLCYRLFSLFWRDRHHSRRKRMWQVD